MNDLTSRRYVTGTSHCISKMQFNTRSVVSQKTSLMAKMKAIVVEHSNRGGVDKLIAKTVPKPENPQGFDLLVRYDSIFSPLVLARLD